MLLKHAESFWPVCTCLTLACLVPHLLLLLSALGPTLCRAEPASHTPLHTCPDWVDSHDGSPALSFAPHQFHPVSHDSEDSAAITVVRARSGRPFDLPVQAFDTSGLPTGGVWVVKWAHCALGVHEQHPRLCVLL